jgi:hypothetical protein
MCTSVIDFRNIVQAFEVNFTRMEFSTNLALPFTSTFA